MEGKTEGAKVQEQRRVSSKCTCKSWQIKAAYTCTRDHCEKKINAFQKENAQRRQRNSDGLGRGGEGLSSMTITDSDTITHGYVLLYTVVVPDTYRFTRELTV